MYVTAEDKSVFDEPFDLSTIPTLSREQAYAEDRTKKLTSATPTAKAPTDGGAKRAPSTMAEATAAASAAAQRYAQQLSAIPEMASYGAVLKSSGPVELTESETEYVVSVVKHIFKEHIVLQYEVRNTLPDTVLERVSVVATPSDEEELVEDFIIPAPRLATDEPGTVYVSFARRRGEGELAVSTFTNVLKFTSKEMDPTTGEPEEQGYDDEYQVEDVELSGGDYMLPQFAASMSHVWEQIGAKLDASVGQAEETLALSGVGSVAGESGSPRRASLTLADATEQLARTLCLQPLEGSDVPVNATTHRLKLLGRTVRGGRVAADVRMAYSASSGVTCKITVRAEEAGVAALLLGAIA
jgi:coatomer protein complex subunit gamma